MPIDDGNQSVSKRRELAMIQIMVSCDGTTNTVVGVSRIHHPVARDGQGAIVFQGDDVVKRFALADLSGAQQTALTNLVNAIDTKP